MDLRLISTNDLARACANSTDAAEWQELLRRTAPLASLVVIRVARLWMNGASNALVDDIVQEVFLKLCEQNRRILREFEPRGEDSFLGLLRIVAASAANDYFRRMHSTKRGGKVVTIAFAPDTLSAPAAAAGDPARLQMDILLSQLDRRLRTAPNEISERDRSLFWLYYLQGFTAEEIASLPSVGLTAKGVESAVRRVAIWLRGQLEHSRFADHPGQPCETALALAQEDSARSR